MSFAPDRATYIRSHWTMAAVFMAAGMLVLWLMGNPHVWTGAVGGLAAVALRGWYVMDEALAEVWTLEGQVLHGPGQRQIALSDVTTVRPLGSSVQIVTTGGDKNLIKYQADPQATARQVRRAAGQDTT